MNEVTEIWFDDTDLDAGLDEYLMMVFSELQSKVYESNPNNFHQYEYQ